MFISILQTENADQLKVIIPVTDLPEADQKDDRGKLKRKNQPHHFDSNSDI